MFKYLEWFFYQGLNRIFDPLDGLWQSLGFKPFILGSDFLIYLLLGGGLVWGYFAWRREYWRVALRQVLANRVAMLCFGILCVYGLIGVLDTLHFREVSPKRPQGGEVRSVLDVLCKPLRKRTEKTYSAPFATYSFSKENITLPDGKRVRGYKPLLHAGKGLTDRKHPGPDIRRRILAGLAWGLGAGVFFALLLLAWRAITARRTAPASEDPAASGASPSRQGRGWGVVLFLSAVALLVSLAVTLSSGPGGYHLFGTDKAGLDVFYIALKGVRTGLVIGTLTTLIVTPFAILFGVLAGYFGGWVDDLIQYVYTTLASIPSILLIAAAMLIFRVGWSREETFISADKRLVYLCLIMGITSWTGLCRLLRGEVLKLREIEYIQAANAFGVRRAVILFRHLVPNVMHIVLISVILRFSGLVLAEAVLAYVGIGVDLSMQSWGNMINQARLELARDPAVWWNLLAAFVFMFGLILPANLFGDAVRDALDPRLRTE